VHKISIHRTISHFAAEAGYENASEIADNVMQVPYVCVCGERENERESERERENVSEIAIDVIILMCCRPFCENATMSSCSPEFWILSPS
jgi:hypothetical protein